MPPAYYYRCNPPRTPGGQICRPNHVRANPLDTLVWEEIRKHLLAPELLVRTQAKARESTTLDSSFFATQVDNAKKRLARVRDERRRLIDAYQGGFLEKKEFEDRAQTVAQRVDTLENELQVLEQEHRHAGEGEHLLERLDGFASLLTDRLDAMSFEQRQALVRAVLEEVVLCGDTVKLYFKIPLPKPPPPARPPGGGSRRKPQVSSEFALRSRGSTGRRFVAGSVENFVFVSHTTEPEGRGGWYGSETKAGRRQDSG